MPLKNDDTLTITAPPRCTEEVLNLRKLQHFLKSPSKVFYKERLGITFTEQDEGDDDEPFTLNPLDIHQITNALLQTGLTGDSAAYRDMIERIKQQGVLPPRSCGKLLLDPVIRNVEIITQRWRQLDTQHSLTGKIYPLRHAAHGLLVEDTLHDLRHDEDNRYLRLLTLSGKLKDRQCMRHHHLLEHWVTHVLVNANALPTTTHIVAADAEVHLAPLDVSTASPLPCSTAGCVCYRITHTTPDCTENRLCLATNQHTSNPGNTGYCHQSHG